MEKTSISSAIKQICDEKGIAYEAVLETIESALAAAYRKDFGNKLQNIKVKFNPETGEIKAFDVKTVAEDLPPEEIGEQLRVGSEPEDGKPQATETRKTTEIRKNTKSQKTQNHKSTESTLSSVSPEASAGHEGAAAAKVAEDSKVAENAETEGEAEKLRFNPRTMIQLSEALEIDKKYKIGDEIVTPLPVPGAFGRMAAQTAKQVIIQKLREAERDTLYQEFKAREGEVLISTIQRREGRVVLVDLGRVTALMLPDGQIKNENYLPGQHLKVYLVSAEKTTKGPEIIVSRSHPNIVKKLFETEIPEIANGTVEIKGIAREAGLRTKIAVFTADENIDPIGSCIGQRGARVQTIIAELKGEKIDIIQYVDDPTEYLAKAMSPAKISEIKIDEKNKTALVSVNENQLSLAIGRGGQNVRLASQLTGWKIDIVQAGGPASPAGGEKGSDDNNVSKVENEKPRNTEAQKTTEARKTTRTQDAEARKGK